MTPLGKLIAATLIVATGLGVASLLGEPAALTQALHTASSPSQLPVIAAAPAEVPAAVSYVPSCVQLLPESAAANNAANGPEAPAIGAPVIAFTTMQPTLIDSQPANGTAAFENSTQTHYGRLEPRARLRNEAPRPIGIEPRSPATIGRMPQVTTNNLGSETEADPYAVAASLPAPQLLPAGYTSDGNATAANTASYEEPVRPADVGNIATPPWPAVDESTGPRTHVIIDGDSLERLAGRYLNDPGRSAEIYELNREVLSNPDLLPIGAELKIPDRSAKSTWDHQGRRPTNVREAASGSLTPVRSIPSTYSVIPRAQLTRPLPVE